VELWVGTDISEEPVSSTFVVQDYGNITIWCRC